MTITKQNKRYFILLAVVIMVALMSVACKKKVTDPVASFSAEEVVTPDDSVTPDEEGLKPISGLTINANNDLRQFNNFAFVNADGGVAKVGFEPNVQYYLELGGIRFYQGAGPACKGAKYVLLAGSNRADVTFTSDGYMTVAIYGGATTKYALQSK